MLETFDNDELQKLNPDQTALSSSIDLQEEQSPNKELNIKNSGLSVTTGDPEPITDPIKKNPVNKGQAFNPAQPVQAVPEEKAQGPDFFKNLYNKLDFTNTDIKNESDFTYKLLHDEEFRNEINGLLNVSTDNDSFTDAIYGQFNNYSGPYVDPDVKLANNEDWLNNLPQAFEKFRHKLSSPDAIIGGVPDWLQTKINEGIDQIVQDPEDEDSFYIVGKTPNGTIGVTKAKNTENQDWLSNLKDSLTNILIGTGASVVSTAAELMNLGYQETHKKLYDSYDLDIANPGQVDKLKNQYINANLPTSINYEKPLSEEEYAKLGLDEKFFKGLDEVFDSKYWIGGTGDQGAVSALEIMAESYVLSRLGVKIPGLGKAGKAIDDVVGAGTQTFKRAGNWAATVGLYAAVNTGLEASMEGRAKFQELYDRYKQTYPEADENTIVEAARNGMLETMSLNVEAISASNILESALLHIPVGKIGNGFLGIAAKTPFSGALEGTQELMQYGIGKYIDDKYKSLIPETTSHQKTLEEIARLVDEGINNDKEAMDSFIAGAVLGAGMPVIFDTKEAISNEIYKHYNKNLISIAHEQLYNGNSAMFKQAIDSKGKPLTIFNKDAVASFDNFASSILKNNNQIQQTLDKSENFLDSKDDVQVLLTERMSMFLDNAIRREPELLQLSPDKLEQKLSKVILKETDFDKSDYRQMGFDKKLTYEDWNEMRHTALNTALKVFEQFGDVQNTMDHVGNLTTNPELKDHINTKINQNIYKLRAINAALATARNNTFTTRDIDPNLTEDQIKEQLGENEEYDAINKKIISKSDPKKYDKYTKLLNLNSNTIISDGLISLDKNKINELIKNLEEDFKREQEEAVKHEETRQDSVLQKVLNKAKQTGSNLSKKSKNYSLIERMFGKKKTIENDNPSNLTSNEDINQTSSGSNTDKTSDKTNTESITNTTGNTSTTTQQQDDTQDRPEESTSDETNTNEDIVSPDEEQVITENDEYEDNIRIPQIGDRLRSLTGGYIEIIDFNDLGQPIVLDNGEQYEITKSQFSEALKRNILSYEEAEIDDNNLSSAELEQKYKEAIENHAAKYDKSSGISPVDYFDNVLDDINTNIKDQKIRERLVALVEKETNKLLKTLKVDDTLDMLESIIQNKNSKYFRAEITPDGFVKYNHKTIPEQVEGYASSIAYTAREDKKLLDVKTGLVSFHHNTNYNFPQLKLLSSKHIKEGDFFRIISIDTNPVLYIPFADDFNVENDPYISRIEKPLSEWFVDNNVRSLKISDTLSIEVTKEDFYDIQIQSLSTDVKASLHIPTFFNRSNTSEELIGDRIQKNLIFRRQSVNLFNNLQENQIAVIPLVTRNYGPLNTIHTNNMGNLSISSRSIENYDGIPTALYLNGELTFVEDSDLDGLAHLDISSIDFSEIYNGRPVMLVDDGVGKVEAIPLRTPTIEENVQNVLLEIAESVISNKPMRDDLYQAFIKLDSKYRDLYNKDKNGNIRYFNFELFNELFKLYANPQTKNEKSDDPSITGSFIRLDYDKNNKPIIKVKGFNRKVAKHFNQLNEKKKYNQKELKDELALLKLSLNKDLLQSNKELPTLHVANETTVLVTYPYAKYIRHNLKTYIEPIKIDSSTYTARINPILELGTPQIQNIEDTATLATSGVKPVSEQTVGQQDAVEPTVAFNSIQTFGNVITNTQNDIEAKKADIEKRRQEELIPLIKEIEKVQKEIDDLEKENKTQGAYDFTASSNSGKWNSANNELLSLVQNNRKAFSTYKLLIGDMETFKEIVDFLNELGIEIPYTDRMKRADETMTAEERKSAIDSYNNSVDSKVKDKAQVEKDILSENNLQDETDYTPQELIEKYPLTGVQKVIWNLIEDVVNKLGIKVKFSSSRITEGFDGSNNPLNGEILIRPSTLKSGRFGEVLVHEVVHALTTKIISRVNLGVTTGLTQKQINAVKGLMKLFEAVKADNNLENKYPVKDVFEFIAHLTNDTFVKELESKDKSFLQKVVDFITDILGITNANELAKQYLKDIISDGTFLQEQGITVLASDYSGNLQESKENSKLQELKNKLKELKQQVSKINAKYDAELIALNNSTTQVVTNELSDIIDNLPLDNISAEETKKVKILSALSILNNINPDEINPSMIEKTTEEILQNTKSLINFASPETYGETQNKDC